MEEQNEDDDDEMETLAACSSQMEEVLKTFLKQKENYTPLTGYKRIIVNAFKEVCPLKRRTKFNKIMDIMTYLVTICNS